MPPCVRVCYTSPPALGLSLIHILGSTHDYVLFVTSLGRVFRLKGYTIAESSRTSKGTNIVNLLQLAEVNTDHKSLIEAIEDVYKRQTYRCGRR